MVNITELPTTEYYLYKSSGRARSTAKYVNIQQAHYTHSHTVNDWSNKC